MSNTKLASILAVDDTPTNLSLLANLLRDRYQVRVATSGQKALDLAFATPPDLILLDVMMPEMDGHEVIRRLKADPRTARVPVMFLTAKNSMEDEEFGLSLGAVDFIHKPISPPIVLARINTQLQNKSWQDYLESKVEERTVELANANADLQLEMATRERLESALIQVSEEQQKSIGRDLHDGLGQHLTSIAFFGAALQQNLETQKRPEAGAAQRIVDLVNQSIDMTRRVSHGLYPAALESQGLAVALEELADNTRALKGIGCDLRADPAVRVDDPVIAINLYRLAQEAVNNAVKHGKARHVHIDLSYSDGHNRLSISDDGIGINPEQIGQSLGLGMYSLRERASLLGGTLEIGTPPQGGTTISVTYPVERVP
jgi:signal transduction histidine kinase